MILSELAPLVSMQHGVFYHERGAERRSRTCALLASYAYSERKHLANRFKAGEGLVGQCGAREAADPAHAACPTTTSRSARAWARRRRCNIVVLPVLFEGEVKAVIELASFHRFSEIHLTFLDQLTESIGIVLNTIGATMRTEELLKQSQSLAAGAADAAAGADRAPTRGSEQQARTLQAVRGAAEAAAGRAAADQRGAGGEGRAAGASRTGRSSSKNREIELARAALEEKAEQLALTSKYKSEFLANMSHELRTPLNSLLILSKLLSRERGRQPDATSRSSSPARSTRPAPTCSTLINEILDLPKIESGTMEVDVTAVPFAELQELRRARRSAQVAEQKGLDLRRPPRPRRCRRRSTPTRKRLQQVLKNLLSNAFKFTEQGSGRR